MIFFEKASQAYQFADGRPLARQASPRVRRSRSKFRSLNDRTKRRLPASRLPIRPRSGVSDCRAVALPLEWTKGPQGRIPPASSPGAARFQRLSVLAEISRACGSCRRRADIRRRPWGVAKTRASESWFLEVFDDPVHRSHFPAESNLRSRHHGPARMSRRSVEFCPCRKSPGTLPSSPTPAGQRAWTLSTPL